MIIKMSRKAQEEIVGFVAIVLLVTIVVVVFLGITVNKNPDQGLKESRDLHRFLESTAQFTTECALDRVPVYADIQDLLKTCYQEPDKSCISEENACVVLNKTLNDILHKSFNVDENSKIRGYIFNSTFSINSTKSESEEILSIQKGNCTANFVEGSDFFSNYPGKIEYSIRLCYA